MGKFADQLRMQGAFEKALKRYKEALRTQQEAIRSVSMVDRATVRAHQPAGWSTQLP